VAHWMRTLIIVALLVIPLVAVFAQDPPPPPPDDDELPPGISDQPPVDTDLPPDAITIPGLPDTDGEDDFEAFEESDEAEETVEVVADSLRVLVAARLDLELLAGEALGNNRPEGWSGTTDINDPQLVLLTRLDLELLAGALQGANRRPDGWFGVVASTPYAVARDIRHDLELLADVALGVDQRPNGWQGAEPLLRCDRATQAVVVFLELNGVFTLQADRTAPDFCRQAALEASLFMEINYLANPLPGASLTVPGVEGVAAQAGGGVIDSNFAVGFFDRNAVQRAGVIPNGTPIQPVGRSYVQFSNMMLVRGEGFELFIDYQFTTVTPEQFRALPDIDTLQVTPVCVVDEWCAGR
jgi:hypothetical protein